MNAPESEVFIYKKYTVRLKLLQNSIQVIIHMTHL